MEKRNRAQGWKHAKLSGHENESNMEKLLQGNDSALREALKGYIGEDSVSSVSIGGLNETDVPCVLGGKTKSKTDCSLTVGKKQRQNISIKKSKGGQAYLISADRFIRGFEFQYKLTIPTDVKRAIHLFFGSAPDTMAIVEKFGTQKSYEKRKSRIVADTLKIYDEKLYTVLIDWFTKFGVELFDFCFSKGLAANSEDWAQLIWFKNTLGENDLNEVFNLEDIKKKLKNNSTATYGRVGGGTTIQLPFGFVQWHSPTKRIPGDLQFHYDYDKMKKIADGNK